MIARYQMLLRQGKPRMDLGIVRLDYNFNNMVFSGDEKELYEKKLMRGNEGLYWKDMQLQNAGYTWDYFAPQLLEEEFVDFTDGELLPDGPGYQALIFYQNVLPLKTAEKLLAMAKKGLPILFVNGVNETLRPFGVTRKIHIKHFSKWGSVRAQNLRKAIKISSPMCRKITEKHMSSSTICNIQRRNRSLLA